MFNLRILKKGTVLVLLSIILLATLIRFWDLSHSPVGLYWDEMDVGYQAYSILKTGKDYFGNFLPLTPHSFADFRAPLLIYADIPFVYLFGLSGFAVRFPAALAGVLSILMMYFVAKQLLGSNKLALLSALFLTLSPWHIQYSRMSFEVTLMLLFFLLGVYGFNRGLKDSRWFVLSSLGFILSMLSYNTAKFFPPLFIFVLIFLNFKLLRKKINRFVIGASGLLGVMYLVLIFSSIYSGGGQRFSEISVFTDPQIASQIDFLRHDSGMAYSKDKEYGQNARFWDKIIYNKPLFLVEKISTNFLQAYSTQFLFLTGDPNLRHSVSAFGELYRFEFLALILGLGVLLIKLKQRDKNAILLVFWLLLAPLPSVITREGGEHATRLFFMLPVLCLIVAMGLGFLFSLFQNKLKYVVIFSYFFIWIFSFISFTNFYLGTYKFESLAYFQAEFDTVAKEALNEKEKYDYVIIDDRKDSALMNYLFETKIDPGLFQSIRANMSTKIKRYEANKIDNVYLMQPGTRNWHAITEEEQFSGDYLLIISALQMDETTPEKLEKNLPKTQKLLKTIYYPNGVPAFYKIDFRP